MVKIKCVIDDAFHFSLYHGDIDRKGINKTNIIDLNQMYFSVPYIQKNSDLVSAFFQVIALKKNITKIYIAENSLAPLLLVILKKIPTIQEVYLLEDKTISYECVEELINNKNITYVNCYNMTFFLLDRINLIRNIKIDTRFQLKKRSPLIDMNQLSSYSDVFYKKKLYLTKDMITQNKNEIDEFLYVNAKLKYIVIDYTSFSSFQTILKFLKKKNLQHLTIQIRQIQEYEAQLIEDIPKIKELLKKEQFHHVKIIYHEQYKQKNILKQINLNILKTACIIMIISIIFIFIIQFTTTTIDKKNYEKTEDKIHEIMKQYHTEISAGVQSPNVANTTDTSQTLKELKQINPDVFGIIDVPNTNIYYPLVQTTDNEYYLSHNIYKQNNKYGWIFMDYRNLKNINNRNIILYGHDSGKSMFGTLKNVLNETWLQNTDNHIITLNIENTIYKYQIFSVYTTPVTSDYLRVQFATDSDFYGFATMLQNRSSYQFPVTINPTDSILTLSTCHNKERLVVHAKRII